MQEILPGLHHWRARHPGIGQLVDSYFVEPAGVVIDPLVPEEGLEWFADRRPQQVVLTIHHHWRDAERIAEEFGCPIRLSRAGVERLEDGRHAEPFSFGEELAPGITAIEIGSLAPDETSLHLAVGPGAIHFADGLVRWGGGGAPLSFVPDSLMGDDPDGVRDGLRSAYRGLLERDFDALLFAHGEPIRTGGRAALKDFLNKPVGQEDWGDTA